MPWDTSFPDFNVSKKKLFYVTPENMQIAFFNVNVLGHTFLKVAASKLKSGFVCFKGKPLKHTYYAQLKLHIY